MSAQFDNLSRFEYFYDTNDNVKLFKTLQWDALTSNYVYSTQALFSYSGNSGPDYMLGQIYNSSSTSWINQNENFLEYDVNGNLSKDSTREYDAQNMSWYPYFRFREFYTYDSNNFYNVHLLQDWISGSWMNSDSISRVADSTGLAVEYYTSIWNSGSNAWDNDNKVVISYQGVLLTDSIVKSWNGSGYINSYKYHYDYLGNGKVFIKSGSSWDNGTNAWNLTAIDTLFYDVNNNLIQDNFYFLDNNNQWTPFWIIYFNYGNCLFSGVAEFGEEREMIAYPNPTSLAATISFPYTIINGIFRLLTLSSQIVYESKGINGNSIIINVSELPEGIYIGEMLKSDNVLRVKLIIN